MGNEVMSDYERWEEFQKERMAQKVGFQETKDYGILEELDWTVKVVDKTQIWMEFIKNKIQVFQKKFDQSFQKKFEWQQLQNLEKLRTYLFRYVWFHKFWIQRVEILRVTEKGLGAEFLNFSSIIIWKKLGENILGGPIWIRKTDPSDLRTYFLFQVLNRTPTCFWPILHT